MYIAGELQAELAPDRDRFGNLPHPPFFFSALSGTAPWRRVWGDIRIDGYLGERKAASRTLSSRGVDQEFRVEPDDAELIGDGIDATRVILRVTDEFGAPRPFATGAVAFEIEGPGELVGENPFALFGGVGAVWVRTRDAEGTIILRARHPVLGTRTVRIEVRGTPTDVVDVGSGTG